MDDSDEDSESGSEDGGGGEKETAAAAAAAAEAVAVAVVEVLAATPAKERERDGDVFASRIAAHAECTKRLWRARYLAMRDVRMLSYLIYKHIFFVRVYHWCIARGGISHVLGSVIPLA